MRPSSSFNNSLDSRTANMIFLCQFTQTIYPRFIFITYCQNILSRQSNRHTIFTALLEFIDWRQYSDWSCMARPKRGAAFCKHILHISFSISQKEMIRSHTKRVITFVKNPFSDWNFSNKNHPCSTMSEQRFTIFASAAKLAITTIIITISSFSAASCPKPTKFSFFNMSQESSF